MMERALKALAFWGATFCNVAHAQFISELKQPQRSGKRFVFYLGAVYVSDSNVYLDESSPVADSVVRGLAALSYETETTNRFFRFGYEFVYPYYLENADLTEPQHRGLVMYDQKFSWGKVFISDEFRQESDPVNVLDPGVDYPGKKMVRMVNKLDPRVRLDLGKIGLEASADWEFANYSPAKLDYLNFSDLSFGGEGIFAIGSKNEAFAQYRWGFLDYTGGAGPGEDYSHSRLCGGMRGEPSPKLAYEIAAGMLGIELDTGTETFDYYVSARATWEPTPGINRLGFGYRRDVRPSALWPYAIVNKGEVSYGHWIMSRLHVEAGGSFESGGPSAAANSWQTIGAFGGVRYELRKFRYLFARGEYRSRDSNIPGASFDDVRLMGGLVYRF